MSAVAPALATESRLRIGFALLNVVGGVAVLGSYALGLATHPDGGGAVWGGVPEEIRPLYTVCMLLAAAGYFLFTHYVYFRLDPSRVRVFGRFGFGAFLAIYAAILLPSAAWMPLTFRMVEHPDPALWIAIRLVLFVVGGGSVALIGAVASAEPRGARAARGLAITGAVLFSIQTALLDALVWPAYFPTG